MARGSHHRPPLDVPVRPWGGHTRVREGGRGREGGGRGGRESKDDTDAARDGDPGGAVLEEPLGGNILV